MADSNSMPARLIGSGFKCFSLAPMAIIFVIVVCMSLLATQLWTAWRARDVQLNEAARESSNLAQSVAQHAYDTIKEADTALVGLVERIEKDGVSDLELSRIHTLLAIRVKELPVHVKVVVARLMQLFDLFLPRWRPDPQRCLVQG